MVLASAVGIVAIAGTVFLLFMLIGSVRLRREKQRGDDAGSVPGPPG